MNTRLTLNLIAILLNAVVYFFTNHFMSNKLSPTFFGSISGTIAYIKFFGILITFGVDIILLRYIPSWHKNEEPEKILSLVNSIFNFLKPIYLFVFFFGIALALLVVFFKEYNGSIFIIKPILLFSYTIVLMALSFIFSQFLVAINKTVLATVVIFLGQQIIFFTLIVFCSIVTHEQVSLLYFFLVSYAVSLILVNSIGYFRIKNFLKKVFPSEIKKDFGHFFHKSMLPSYTLQRLGFYVFTFLPIVLLDLFDKNKHDVATLTAIISICGLIRIPLTTISMTFTPYISIALSKSVRRLLPLLAKIRFMSVLAAMLLISICAVFARKILISFNPQFENSTIFLYLWLFRLFIASFLIGINHVVRLSRKSIEYGNIIWITVLAIQIIAGSVASYFYHLAGITVVSILSTFIYLVLLMIFSAKVLKQMKRL